jgi:alpha-mannosidase
MFEVCGHQFADLSEGDYGVALLNDCKYGYSCCGSTLCLSLLRAPKSPDPDCDMGVHTFKYGLYLHQGGTIHSGDVHRVASCFNAPVLKCEVPVHQSCDDARLRSPMSNHTASTSLVKICSQNCGLVIETVKLALNGQHIIIRFVEKSGTRGRAMVWFSFDVTLATATNLMEEPVPDASVFFEVVSPFELSLFYEPFKILTIRIPH